MQQICHAKTLIPQSINVWFLGPLGFNTTYRIQQLLASKHHATMNLSQKATLDTLLLVEHFPGISCICKLLCVSSNFGCYYSLYHWDKRSPIS